MRLNSTAFADGSAIPRRFTCDGEDLSPSLNWSDAPTGTRSFALLCDDPDAPAGTWHHWAAYDIPATLTMLALGAASDAEKRLGSSRQSMIFNGPATAAHARRVATACIIIIFACSRSRSTTFPSAAHRPVARSNARHAGIPLPKGPLLGFTSDDGSAVLNAPVYGPHGEWRLQLRRSRQPTSTTAGGLRRRRIRSLRLHCL